MVSSSFLPGRGGIESYLAELCDLLAPRLAVLAAGSRDGKPLPSNLGYPTHPFHGRLLWPGRAATSAIVRASRIEDTDKVLLGTPWPLVLLGPRLAARGLRYSVIVHGAEMLVPSAVPMVRSRLARALAGAELLLPVSHYTADALRSFLTKHGETVPPIELLRARVDLERFHPGVDTSAVRERYGIGEHERVVLCFGRLVERKGVGRAIRALPVIARRVPEVVLVVAGTGPESRSLQDLARKNGLQVAVHSEHHAASTAEAGPRVIFTGRVPEEDAPAVYAMADVFTLPVVDRWFGLEIEGLGVVLLEAAGCGVPCVTGRSGGTPEAVLDKETGFVIDSRDEAALADRITTLLEDRELAEQMGRAGRKHVGAEFSERSLPPALLAWLST